MRGNARSHYAQVLRVCRDIENMADLIIEAASPMTEEDENQVAELMECIEAYRETARIHAEAYDKLCKAARGARDGE